MNEDKEQDLLSDEPEEEASDEPEEEALDYYLQVVKVGEKPKWPRPEEELVVGQQSLAGDLIQYWAYPADSEKGEEALPPAENLAAENPTPAPAILIDQTSSDRLELVLVKEGHAWARTYSNQANLEDNISGILDFAGERYNIKVGHFMTTNRVSGEVEKKLDELEEAEEKEGYHIDREEVSDEEAELPPVNKTARSQFPTSGIYSSNKSSGAGSKAALIIPLLIVVAIFAGAVMFRGKILTKINKITGAAPVVTPTPTIIPTATPTPTPAIDRSKYTIKVLNGTTKTGAAATLADKLKSLGWSTTTPANATNSATLQTLVRVKKDMETVAAVLTQDLAPDLTATTSADLPTSTKYDAEVVIGNK